MINLTRFLGSAVCSQLSVLARGRTARRIVTIATFSWALCVASAAEGIPAFPGAEGFGAQTKGGRGGRVLVVSNLNDSGPGSFREACNTSGPRTVVFAVSGLIDLLTPLEITEPRITIAAQTAPGEGICLKGCGVVVRTSEVIIRFLRTRPGAGSKTATDALSMGGDSAGPEYHNAIFDHCSASWSVDAMSALTASAKPPGKGSPSIIDARYAP